MKKLSGALVVLVAVLALIKVILTAQSSPEKVFDIVKYWSMAWGKGVVIITIVIAIIFLINKLLEREWVMSVVGMICMPVLIPALLYICFGFIMWLSIFGVVAGLIIGYFSYIIDDHLLEAWKVRHIVLPLFFGLAFGCSTIIAALAENWQDEYLFVNDYATCHELNLQRYTMHVVVTKKSTTVYYSWDTYKTLYFFNRGEQFKQPQENRDYVLGTGALGKKDQVSDAYHKWIGGEKLNSSGESLGFKWIYLAKLDLKYDLHVVSDVEENYFGQAIKDGKPKDIPVPTTFATNQKLPTGEDVPGMFSMSFDFFKIMFTNPDFSLMRWIYLSIYLIFGVCAIFWVKWRIAFFVFFISSTIIILIILAIVAARSGRDLSDFMPEFLLGGGNFGGAGSSGRW